MPLLSLSPLSLAFTLVLPLPFSLIFFVKATHTVYVIKETMLKTMNCAFTLNSIFKANYVLTSVNHLAWNISINLHTIRRNWFLSVRRKMLLFFPNRLDKVNLLFVY